MAATTHISDPMVFFNPTSGLHMLICKGASFSTTNWALLTMFAIPPQHGGVPLSDATGLYQQWLQEGVRMAAERGCTPLVSAVDESQSGPGFVVDWVLVTFVSNISSERPKYAQAIATRIAAEVHMIYHCFGLTSVDPLEVLALRNVAEMCIPEMGAVDVVFFRFRTSGTRAKSAWLAEQRRRLTDQQIYEALLASVQERLPPVEDIQLRGQGLSRDPALLAAAKENVHEKPPPAQWWKDAAERAAWQWITPEQRAQIQRTRALAQEMKDVPVMDTRDADTLSETFTQLATMRGESSVRTGDLLARGPDWSSSVYMSDRDPDQEPRTRTGIVVPWNEDDESARPNPQLEREMAAWFQQQQQGSAMQDIY